MNGNVVTASFQDGRITLTAPLWQYDYGQILRFTGVSLPETYEVHFSNTKDRGNAKTAIGNANGVFIPDEFLTTGGSVFAWVFLHTGEDDGETEYRARIPVNKRAMPSDEVPTPQERSVIIQAIAALNAAVESTSEGAASSSVSATSAEISAANASASASGAETAAVNAAVSESEAKASASAAAQAATQAVNAAEAAMEKAMEADVSAQSANSFASSASSSAQAAGTSATSAGESAQSASASAATAAAAETEEALGVHIDTVKADVEKLEGNLLIGQDITYQLLDNAGEPLLTGSGDALLGHTVFVSMDLLTVLANRVIALETLINAQK